MSVFKFLKKEVSSYFRNIGIYARYQGLTKAILMLLILPLYKLLVDLLVHSFGMTSISSGDYRSVLFSVRGFGFIFILILILVFVSLLDINAFIAISASLHRGRKLGFLKALKEGLKSFPSFFSPAGLVLLVYLILIVPLADVGLRLSSISRSIDIPNFISAVIFDTPLYLGLYITAMLLFAIIGFLLIFSFHYMQLGAYGAGRAIRASVKKVWEKKFFLLGALVSVNLTATVFTALFSALILLFVYLISLGFLSSLFWSRFILVFLLIGLFELINLFVFLMMPFQIHILTAAYMLFEEEALPIIEEEGERTDPPDALSLRPRKPLLVITLLVILLINLSVSCFVAYFFDDIHRLNPGVEIIAHRGGGDMAPENSLEGVLAAYEAGAKWSEIDVMRSKDGVYIINHDKTFERISGVKKQPSELNLSEIRELRNGYSYSMDGPGVGVPTLEEVMDAAKGKIGLFIELKAPAADRLMVDDVVSLIKERDMQEEAVIIALDYSLIEYLEDRYPDIQSGYLYFFALGNTAKINSDYLIMEEAVLRPDVVSRIHREGRKAAVWTVNSFKYLRTYVTSGVDAIITDYVNDLKSELSKLNEKSDIDLIWLDFKNFIEGVLN